LRAPGLSGTLDRARQDAAEAERRAGAAETQAERTAEALEVAQAAQAGAERVAVDLRLEVATLTERAAHVADLRAIIAGSQVGAEVRTDASALELEAVPSLKPKTPVRRRRQDHAPTGATD
jgi:hypothetical protein